MLAEWIKHRVIASPLYRPAESLRELASLRKRRRNPELSDIFQEGPRAREVIARTVTNGMHCLDVGCHLGSVLREIVTHSPRGQHAAVEPLPYKARWLRKTYPNVEIVEAAVAEEVGQIDFTWNKSRSGFSSLAGGGLANDVVERLTVQTLRLDDIVPAERTIGFMKVDTEGAELMAFRSAERILTTDRPLVLFECARRSTEALGFQVDDVFTTLTDRYGYRVMYLHEYLGTREPLDLDTFKKSMFYPFKAFNFVAVPA